MMKKLVFGILTFSFIVTLSGVLITKKADAIPPFARKYQTACPTCHVVIPRLNPFGRAFRANGYRIPGGADEVFTKDEPLLLGANPWKKMFPKTIWPSDIPGLPPIGLEVITGMSVGFNGSRAGGEGAKTEFTGIDEFAMLMGGTLGESFSFFGDVNLQKFSSPTLGWIDRMFIQYNPDWFDGKGHVNIRLGEFEPRVVGPFSNHRAIQIMSWFMGYLNTTMPVVAGSVGQFSNLHGFFPTQKGVEVYGGFDGKNGGGWEYAVGIVNGEQAHVADVGTHNGSDPNIFEESRFDFNDQKDWYVSAHYKFGGMGVLGGGGDDSEELSATDNWKDNNGKLPSVKVGGYFYSGSNDFTASGGEREDPLTGANSDVHFIRAQVDVDIFWNNLNLIAGYTLFRDKFGDGDADTTGRFETDANGDIVRVSEVQDGGMDTTMNIFTTEVDYVLLPWIIPVYKYELVKSDFMPTFAKHTMSVTALLRANIKFQAGLQTTTGNDSPGTKTSRIFDDVFAMGIQYDF